MKKFHNCEMSEPVTEEYIALETERLDEWNHDLAYRIRKSWRISETRQLMLETTEWRKACAELDAKRKQLYPDAKCTLCHK